MIQRMILITFLASFQTIAPSAAVQNLWTSLFGAKKLKHDPELVLHNFGELAEQDPTAKVPNLYDPFATSTGKDRPTQPSITEPGIKRSTRKGDPLKRDPYLIISFRKASSDNDSSDSDRDSSAEGASSPLQHQSPLVKRFQDQRPPAATAE